MQGLIRVIAPVRQVLLIQQRGMAVEGVRGFSEREKVVEDLYFNKEDERILRKLLGKLKSQADTADALTAVGVRAAEESALRAIVDKYKISKGDFEALLDWKHHSF